MANTENGNIPASEPCVSLPCRTAKKVGFAANGRKVGFACPFAKDRKVGFAVEAKSPLTRAAKSPLTSRKKTSRKNHKTPRREYVSQRKTWVWNREGVICASIYCGAMLLTLLAHVLETGVWLTRAVLAFLVYYALGEWRNWRDMFSWRSPRRDPHCLSHTQRPAPRNSYLRHRFQKLPELEKKKTYVRGYTPRTPESNRFYKAQNGKMPKHSIGCRLPDDICQGTCLMQAEKPDMDHIYLPFSDYLWCSLFVLPAMQVNVFIGARTGVGILGIIWHRLKQWAGLNPDYNEEAVKKALVDSLLGFSLLVWSKKEGSVLKYTIPAMTHIDPRNGTVIAGDFILRVEYTKRTFLGATWRKHKLSPAATLGLLMNAFAGHSHPLLHGYACWGVNVESRNWFIRRMSIITIKYNNIGVEGWPYVVGGLNWLGLCRTPIDTDNTRLTIHLNHNVPEHSSKMLELTSLPYVHFVNEVRHFFMAEFEKYLDDFEDIDPEALFVGTVLHSIDHRVVAKNFARVLLDAEHAVEPKFRADLEWGLFTCHLATDAPLGRPYQPFMKNASHPFFRDVWKFANRINPELASFMECCIAI